MAEILPIKPWRYNPDFYNDISELTSPLFDVVSEKQCINLYKNPLNSIHLSVPQQPGAAIRAGLLLEEWKKNRILIQDKLPGIYVYYQYFKLPGSSQAFCRKGFICHIRAYDWGENIILRHENTIPHAVNDRIELLENTELHVSPTHGLYTDTSFELEKYMDEAIQTPVYETEDYQGVRDVLAVIHDAQVIQKFISRLKSQTVILADGHHRYESSLAFKEKSKRANPKHTGNEGYNFHLMYFTNTEGGDLKVLPTHRLIKNIEGFNENKIVAALSNYFVVKPVDDASTLPEIITGKNSAFGLIFKENAYKIILKPEMLNKIPWPFPDVIKKLDLTVLHYFIIEKALGIPGKAQRQSPNIMFDRSFSDCVKKVLQKEAQLAIIINEIPIEDIKIVSRSGYTMPQKSTFFYPKAVCGFLFSSIKQEEFSEPIYSPFNS